MAVLRINFENPQRMDDFVRSFRDGEFVEGQDMTQQEFNEIWETYFPDGL